MKRLITCLFIVLAAISCRRGSSNSSIRSSGPSGNVVHSFQICNHFIVDGRVGTVDVAWLEFGSTYVEGYTSAGWVDYSFSRGFVSIAPNSCWTAPLETQITDSNGETVKKANILYYVRDASFLREWKGDPGARYGCVAASLNDFQVDYRSFAEALTPVCSSGFEPKPFYALQEDEILDVTYNGGAPLRRPGGAAPTTAAPNPRQAELDQALQEQHDEEKKRDDLAKELEKCQGKAEQLKRFRELDIDAVNPEEVRALKDCDPEFEKLANEIAEAQKLLADKITKARKQLDLISKTTADGLKALSPAIEAPYEQKYQLFSLAEIVDAQAYSSGRDRADFFTSLASTYKYRIGRAVQTLYRDEVLLSIMAWCETYKFFSDDFRSPEGSKRKLNYLAAVEDVGDFIAHHTEIDEYDDDHFNVKLTIPQEFRSVWRQLVQKDAAAATSMQVAINSWYLRDVPDAALKTRTRYFAKATDAISQTFDLDISVKAIDQERKKILEAITSTAEVIAPNSADSSDTGPVGKMQEAIQDCEATIFGITISG